ncbi:hypothetical protein GCM10010969_18890 [Saccharibacillus kuerlensis]|uniref:Uncharacterized protein n=1 Tax=Saccharibacillus kuerlensis TaxID=459527 RepID=A0ABQ2L123_9BACL|nr:hypothetical protein GCM10010969_18890 [Saccharibacillus kuerlensis]
MKKFEDCVIIAFVHFLEDLFLILKLPKNANMLSAKSGFKPFWNGYIGREYAES